MIRKPKLELTWICKDERPRLEPRIPIEDPALSHHAATAREGAIYDNMLIQGDNLLALEADAGKVKCICVDPPYDTWSAIDKWRLLSAGPIYMRPSSSILTGVLAIDPVDVSRPGEAALVFAAELRCP